MVMAQDYMVTDVVDIGDYENVLQLLETLGHGHFSGLPVKNEAGAYVGFVSRSDLSHYKVLHYLRENKSLETLTVGEIILKKQLITVSPTTPIADVARMMVEKHIHRVLVENSQGLLVGILTTLDLARALVDLSGDHTQSPPTENQAKASPVYEDPLFEIDDTLLRLKDYEIQLLRLIALDKSLTEMATTFLLDTDTIRAQIQRIMTVLNVNTPKEASAKAIEMGLFNLVSVNKHFSALGKPI